MSSCNFSARDITFRRSGDDECTIVVYGETVGSVTRRIDYATPDRSHYYVVHLSEDWKGPRQVDRSEQDPSGRRRDARRARSRPLYAASDAPGCSKTTAPSSLILFLLIVNRAAPAPITGTGPALSFCNPARAVTGRTARHALRAPAVDPAPPRGGEGPRPERPRQPLREVPNASDSRSPSKPFPYRQACAMSAASALAAALGDRAEEVCRRYLPHGRRAGPVLDRRRHSRRQGALAFCPPHAAWRSRQVDRRRHRRARRSPRS